MTLYSLLMISSKSLFGLKKSLPKTSPTGCTLSSFCTVSVLSMTLSAWCTQTKKKTQAKDAKTDSEFDSILEKVLSLDTKKKLANLVLWKANPKPQKRRKHSILPQDLAFTGRNPVAKKTYAIISIPNKQMKVSVNNLKAESQILSLAISYQ